MTDVPHLGFIVAAYAFAAVTILAMIAAILLDYRALDAKLRALEDARADAAEGRRT
jgi:heme exporter protein CcmD